MCSWQEASGIGLIALPCSQTRTMHPPTTATNLNLPVHCWLMCVQLNGAVFLHWKIAWVMEAQPMTENRAHIVNNHTIILCTISKHNQPCLLFRVLWLKWLNNIPVVMEMADFSTHEPSLCNFYIGNSTPQWALPSMVRSAPIGTGQDDQQLKY